MRYALDSKERIAFNGNEYFIRIRSANEKNPVVLFLHGGCGSPDRAHIIKYQSPLADKFTLVAWDQRGAGYAFNKKQSKEIILTKKLYIEDAHNVVMYLKERFNQERIIVVGHSFGSVLGVWLSALYPQDIKAYVGVGQSIDYNMNEEMSYAWTLKEAKRINDKKAIKILQEIGYPENGKYKNNQRQCILKQRSILHKLGGANYANRKSYWQELLFNELPILAKEYSFNGLVKYIKGLSYCGNSPLANENPEFFNTIKKLEVPVYLLLGHHDYNCPFELAEKWLENLDAPYKKLIWFENSAHSPQWEESEKWNNTFRSLFKEL